MFSQGLQHFTAEAVVPEQLLHYVAAVAGSRPLACAGFPAYLLEGHLVLVAFDAAMLETFSGGPDLEAATVRVKEATDAAARLEAVSVRQSAEAATAEGVQLRVDAAVDAALALPEVRQITVLAPVRPTRAPQDASTGTPDAYWDLELPLLREDGSLPWQKLRNMERRALRDVEVVREAWQPDHAALVQDFLRRKPFEPGTVHIFSHLESYVGSHPDVQLWAARHREDNSLQAFAVGDYASLTTAFYMFAFRRQDAVPGCADALLAGLVCSLLFIAIGLLCGTVLNDKQVGGACGALLTNLTAWLSGIWFDISLLGDAFGSVARALPFYHAVEACRAALNGGAVWGHLAIVLAYAVGILAVAACCFTRQMKQR